MAAAAYDAAHAHPDAEVRKQNQAFYEFLVPLVKGYCTEMSLEVDQPGRAGARRHGLHRGDRRGAVLPRRAILTIYEGTTAIQANDLVGRKTARDGGAVREAIARADRGHRGRAAAQRQRRRAGRWQRSLTAARQAFVDVVDFVAGQTKASPNAVFAGSVPYLMLAGNVVAGWQMARALLAAEDRLAAGSDAAFMQAKIATARFYADHMLSKAPGMRDSIVEGADGVTDGARAF